MRRPHFPAEQSSKLVVYANSEKKLQLQMKDVIIPQKTDAPPKRFMIKIKVAIFYEEDQ